MTTKNVFFIVLLITLCSFTNCIKVKQIDTSNTLDLSVIAPIDENLLTTVEACECPKRETVYNNIGKIDFDKIEIKNKEAMEEIIEKENLGVPQTYEEYIIINKDYELNESVTNKIEGCPKGYRAMNINDINKLSERLGDKVFEVLNDSKIFNFVADKKYILNTKVSEFLENPTDANSFVFEGIQLNSIQKKIEKINMSTYLDKGVLYKCVLDLNEYSLNIQVKGEGVLVNKVAYGKSINLTISNTNIKYLIWQINGVKTFYGDILDISPKKEGCNFIHSWGLLINNQIAYGCQPVYVQAETNTYIDSDLKKSVGNSKTLIKNAIGFKNIHFTPNPAPFTSNLKNQMVNVYTNKLTNELHILLLDQNLTELKDKPLGIKALGFDITRIPKGFAILCRDLENKSHLYVHAINENFEFLWKREIVNNSEKPEVGTQVDEKTNVIFKDKEGNIEFGTNNIFDVVAGRIILGGGRIAVYFSHWNNFGNDSQGNRKDSFGSTLITFDDNGENEKLGYAWGSSPTLYFDLDSDGVNFITSALSGAFPDNIQICTISISNFINEYDLKGNLYKHKVTCKNLLQNGILADGKGGSCGRMGNIVNNGIDTYGVVYSVRSCQFKNLKQNSEFSFLLFDNDLKIKSFTNLGNPENINCVKSAKFGKNVLIIYTVSKDKDIDKRNILGQVISKKDESYIMLLDFEGKIINQPEKLPISFCDEVDTLSDGSIAWSHVHRSTEEISFTTYKPFTKTK